MRRDIKNTILFLLTFLVVCYEKAVAGESYLLTFEDLGAVGDGVHDDGAAMSAYRCATCAM